MTKQIAVLFPVTEAHRETLQKQAPGTEFFFGRLESLSETELSQIEAVLGNPSAEMLPKLTGLKLLQLSSAGVNGCYLAPGALPEGVALCNAAGAYGPAIAEHMLGLLLCLIKRLHQYRDSQRAGKWEDHGPVTAISGSRTLVVGLGDIGSEFGKRMAALGSTVSGVKRTPGVRPDWLSRLETMEKLDEMLPEADFVFLSLPETPATRRLFDRERLGRMKRGAVLLNAGRGSAVDTEALCDAVGSGALLGAGLDVTDPEPLPEGHRMWGIENILITPHVSGGFHLPATQDRVVEICGENLRRYREGLPFTHLVNREQGY